MHQKGLEEYSVLIVGLRIITPRLPNPSRPTTFPQPSHLANLIPFAQPPALPNPIPPPDLTPPTQRPQLQKTHPPRSPTGIPNNNRFPLILWPRQHICPKPFARDDLHRFEPPQHPNQQQRQYQQNARNNSRSRLRAQASLNHATASSGASSDEEGKGLRDGEAGGDAREAGEICALHADCFWKDAAWSTGHARLEVGGVERFHDDAVTFGDGEVREEANDAGENDGDHIMDWGSAGG